VVLREKMLVTNGVANSKTKKNELRHFVGDVDIIKYLTIVLFLKIN
jgi:hypothetical protein